MTLPPRRPRAPSRCQHRLERCHVRHGHSIGTFARLRPLAPDRGTDHRERRRYDHPEVRSNRRRRQYLNPSGSDHGANRRHCSGVVTRDAGVVGTGPCRRHTRREWLLALILQVGAFYSTGRDAGSALFSTPAVTVTAEGTTTVRSLLSMDAAGNAEATRTATVRIDDTASGRPGPTQQRRTRASPAHDRDAADEHPLSGVAQTTWRIDGGEWRAGTSAATSVAGDHVIEYSRSTQPAMWRPRSHRRSE